MSLESYTQRDLGRDQMINVVGILRLADRGKGLTGTVRVRSYTLRATVALSEVVDVVRFLHPADLGSILKGAVPLVSYTLLRVVTGWNGRCEPNLTRG
jgi:hypothetical protein